MYRWQTLTLARVENLLARNPDPRNARDDARTLDLAREILYRVGLRYFPEPIVGEAPATHVSTFGPRSISLAWSVDGREMIVELAGEHVGYQLRHPDLINEGGDLDPSDCVEEVREIAHWLLFGHRPPKAVRAMPASRPGDPLRFGHIESVADRLRHEGD